VISDLELSNWRQDARYSPIEHVLNYMTKSCIKIVISNYVGTFKKMDVEVLVFYKILIIVQLISK
jgi:hypothetical protein